jgi:DNA helicase II / ATP-dependent DNA helicase PcrA
MPASVVLDRLNSAQRDAATWGVGPGGRPGGPLLIIAGAGSGKTNTLAHRVAHIVASGGDPRRILLLTFTRRAATEMIRRAQRIAGAADVPWAGTFHAIANRLLRVHAQAVGLDPAFTVLDRSDGEDLMDLLRQEAGLADRERRFPRKGTCLAIYSRTVNAQRPLRECLEQAFPWCAEHEDALRGLFRSYVAAKQARRVLDYDDLLLYWFHLVGEPRLAREVGGRFDHLLVDEYQDTNALQAEILRHMKPDGAGVTVVGDDAQSIYSFRAATVHNILEFPARFTPPAQVITLAENYRSTQPILDAANAVIGLSAQRYDKQLHSRRASQQRPVLAAVEDETVQVDYVVDKILGAREAGIDLRRQAVLFRAAHHSDALEVELGRRNIPYVKYGGLKFLEAAHVKDLMCLLRWAENPADTVAGFRVLKLMPGIGPAAARRALDHLGAAGGGLRALAGHVPPAAARARWPELCQLLERLGDQATDWRGQVGMVRRFYEPLLLELYDAPHVRAGDLEQLEHIAGGYPSRERFLSELTLDPPESTGDQAGPPLLDEDYLILSTIHSAKGQEWDVVYLLNVVDGCIPSDMTTGNPDEIEEERRLLYVAMTRARDQLHLIHPLRMFIRQQHRHGDRHIYTPASRFLPPALRSCFEHVTRGRPMPIDAAAGTAVTVDVGARLRDMW